MLAEQYFGLATLKRPDFFEFLYNISFTKTVEVYGDLYGNPYELGKAFANFREKFNVAERKNYSPDKLQKTIIALAIYTTARCSIVTTDLGNPETLSANDVTAFQFGLLIYAFESELMSKDRHVYYLRGIDVEKISAEMLRNSIKVIEVAKRVELANDIDGENFLPLRYLYKVMLEFAALHLYER